MCQTKNTSSNKRGNERYLPQNYPLDSKKEGTLKEKFDKLRETNIERIENQIEVFNTLLKNRTNLFFNSFKSHFFELFIMHHKDFFINFEKDLNYPENESFYFESLINYYYIVNKSVIKQKEDNHITEKYFSQGELDRIVRNYYRYLYSTDDVNQDYFYSNSVTSLIRNLSESTPKLTIAKEGNEFKHYKAGFIDLNKNLDVTLSSSDNLQLVPSQLTFFVDFDMETLEKEKIFKFLNRKSNKKKSKINEDINSIISFVQKNYILIKRKEKIVKNKNDQKFSLYNKSFYDNFSLSFDISDSIKDFEEVKLSISKLINDIVKDNLKKVEKTLNSYDYIEEQKIEKEKIEEIILDWLTDKSIFDKEDFKEESISNLKDFINNYILELYKNEYVKLLQDLKEEPIFSIKEQITLFEKSKLKDDLEFYKSKINIFKRLNNLSIVYKDMKIDTDIVSMYMRQEGKETIDDEYLLSFIRDFKEFQDKSEEALNSNYLNVSKKNFIKKDLSHWLEAIEKEKSKFNYENHQTYSEVQKLIDENFVSIAKKTKKFSILKQCKNEEQYIEAIEEIEKEIEQQKQSLNNETQDEEKKSIEKEEGEILEAVSEKEKNWDNIELNDWRLLDNVFEELNLKKNIFTQELWERIYSGQIIQNKVNKKIKKENFEKNFYKYRTKIKIKKNPQWQKK